MDSHEYPTTLTICTKVSPYIIIYQKEQLIKFLFNTTLYIVTYNNHKAMIQTNQATTFTTHECREFHNQISTLIPY